MRKGVIETSFTGVFGEGGSCALKEVAGVARKLGGLDEGAGVENVRGGVSLGNDSGTQCGRDVGCAVAVAGVDRC